MAASSTRDPDPQTRYLNPSGDGEWINAGQHINSTYRDYGTAVVYAPGKLIALGGGDPPVKTAELVDLNVGPTWTSTASMQFARRQLNALVLADGKVLVVGGTSAPGFNTESGSILTPELWDPDTGSWTAMSDMAIPRTYHSTAVLMPDARVLSAGGGRCGGCQVNHLDAQIFSPPYLFNADGTPATRPTITSAPTPLNRGQSFTVSTPDAARHHAGHPGAPALDVARVQHEPGVRQPSREPGERRSADHRAAESPTSCRPVTTCSSSSTATAFRRWRRSSSCSAPRPCPRHHSAPSAPSILTASPVSGAQSNLQWNDNSTSESSFRIERCQGTGCASFAEIDSVGANVTTYTNTGLTSGTAYSYRVRAKNAAGASSYTNVASTGGGGSSNNPPVARSPGRAQRCSARWTRRHPPMTTGSCRTCGIGERTQRDEDGTHCTQHVGDGGRVHVTLTVTDGGGLSNSTSPAEVAVGTAPPPNNPPTANFCPDCNALTCTFNNTSTDNDGNIASSSWTFGDATTSTATSPSHTYAAGATYSVSLTVTDNQGATNSMTKSVTVSVSTAAEQSTGGELHLELQRAGVYVHQHEHRCRRQHRLVELDVRRQLDVDRDESLAHVRRGRHLLGVAHRHGQPGRNQLDDEECHGDGRTTAEQSAGGELHLELQRADVYVHQHEHRCRRQHRLVELDVRRQLDLDRDESLAHVRHGRHSLRVAYRHGQPGRDQLDDEERHGDRPTAAAVIALTAKGSKVKGVQQVDLSWTGATTSTVDVYRGGVVIASPPNNTTTKSGTYRDNLNRKGSATYQYKVCEASSTTVCSAIATVVF